MVFVIANMRKNKDCVKRAIFIVRNSAFVQAGLIRFVKACLTNFEGHKCPFNFHAVYSCPWLSVVVLNFTDLPLG